jgi:2-desacetyl-2-hydroxyethyl bacteriochlorophyllide A dehydrogenase
MIQTLNKTTGYTLMLEAPKKIGIQHYEEKELAPDEVRIKTLYSGISAGTELTAYRGSNPYLTKQWDAEQKLFRYDQSSWSYPMPAIGYEEMGEIIELGSAVKDLKIGDKVWGAWGHKSSHTAKAEWAKVRLLPQGLEPQCGIFSQIGAIALNAILDADIHLGETVAVFGQGVPGLMITQLVKASGAKIIAVDRLEARLEEAKKCGADHLVNSGNVDAAQTIKDLTGGRGADISIEITGIYAALHDAIRATAYNSRVIVSGFFQGDGKGLFLGEEFHHNRIELVCSQIGGVSRRLDHRWDRLRLDHTIMQLQAEKKIDFKRLISHTFPAQQAQEAFTLIDERPAEVLQVVLEFGDA